MMKQRRKSKNNEEIMTKKEKITENSIRSESMSVTTGAIDSVKMTKVEKMIDSIAEKFGVYTNIFKSGGRWSVMLKNENNMDNLKIKEIREYVIIHSEDLEEDDNI